MVKLNSSKSLDAKLQFSIPLKAVFLALKLNTKGSTNAEFLDGL